MTGPVASHVAAGFARGSPAVQDDTCAARRGSGSAVRGDDHRSEMSVRPRRTHPPTPWLCVVPVGLPVGPARRVPNPVSCACVVFPTGPPPASAILRGLACRFLQGGVNACAGVNGRFWVSSISRRVLQVLSAGFAGKRRADRRPQNLRTNLRNLPAGFAPLRLASFASFLAGFAFFLQCF